MDVPVNGCDVDLNKTRKDCDDPVSELHTMGAVSDQLLLHKTGMKWKTSRTVQQDQRCISEIIPLRYTGLRLPAFQDTHVNPENLLNVGIKDMPVRLRQSAGNIDTSRTTAIFENKLPFKLVLAIRFLTLLACTLPS